MELYWRRKNENQISEKSKYMSHTAIQGRSDQSIWILAHTMAENTEKVLRRRVDFEKGMGKWPRFVGWGTIEYRGWSCFWALKSKLKILFLCISSKEVGKEQQQSWEQIIRFARLKMRCTILRVLQDRGPKSSMEYIKALTMTALKICHSSLWETTFFKMRSRYSRREHLVSTAWKCRSQDKSGVHVTPRILIKSCWLGSVDCEESECDRLVTIKHCVFRRFNLKPLDWDHCCMLKISLLT